MMNNPPILGVPTHTHTNSRVYSCALITSVDVPTKNNSDLDEKPLTFNELELLVF